MFVLKVPKDFGKKSLTWTIVANGERQSVPLTLNPGYPITPFKELGMGNQPPVLSFSEGGAKVTGPPDEGGGHPHRQGRAAGADSGVGGGSEARG